MEIITLGKYLIIYIMAMVFTIQKLMENFKEIGKMVGLMDLESVLTQWETGIQAFTLTIKELGKVLMSTQMEKSMKDTSKKIVKVDLESIFIKMEISMKDSGRMTCIMEKEFRTIKMAPSMMVIG